ncbi:hypothetical protein ACFYY2_12380 [Streptomyces sp. NPDC001822]|uniref:hypothetical protein n=1 Tax=Streptomyces sp. NPDC001822 TaxID=3364614 RepID=UPI0036BAAF6A
MTEKIRVTVVMEYTPNLKHYPDEDSVAAAAEFDARENPFEEFPSAYLDDLVSVAYEVIPAE